MKDLNTIEKTWNVKAFNYKGMELWPVIRYTCGGYLHNKNRVYNNVHNDFNNTKRAYLLFTHLKEMINSLLYFLIYIVCGRSCSYLFVSSKNNQSVVDDLLVDRVVDPLINELGDGCIKLAFSQHRSNGKPRYLYKFNLSYVIYFFLFFIFFKNIFIERSLKRNLFWELKKCFNQLGFSCSYIRYIKILSTLEAGLVVYGCVLAIGKPKKVFFSNCYSLHTVPGVYAANIRNIESNCIQHGVQSKEHYAFNFSNNLSFNTIPRKYLVWNEESIGNINGFSKAEVIGFKWSEYISKQCILSEASKLRAGYKFSVLITTQPTTGIFSDKIYQLIKNNEDVFFFYRLHPSQANPAVYRELAQRFQGCKNIEIQYSSLVPLPIFLQEVDIHITGFSSCVIEAINQNCFTIVYHPKAKEYFKSYLDGGQIQYCEIEKLSNINLRKYKILKR